MEPVGPLPRGASRAEMVDEVARVLGRAGVPDGATVVVGASGGADSAALLALLQRARSDLSVLAVHVRHGLREADGADVEVAREQAHAVGAGFEVAEVDVVPTGEGLEAAARQARHTVLAATAGRASASALLLGHTADDQAETMLLRAARGTGVDGLGAMASITTSAHGPAGGAHVAVVRPMLRLRRADVRALVAGLGWRWLEDPSNLDPAFARTGVRHRAIPALAEHAGDPVGALGRLADLARDDASHLDDLARRAYRDGTVRFGPVTSLAEDALASAAPALARRLARLLLVDAGMDRPDAAMVGAVLSLPPGRLLARAGVQVSRGGGWIAGRPAASPVPSTAVDLPIDEGRALIPWSVGLGLAVEVGTADSPAQRSRRPAVPPGARRDRAVVVLAAGAVLRARPARPGDRIHTAGGTRKVADLLVDHGVPRLVRDHLPVVVAADGRVVWVPGLDADPTALAQPGDPGAAHLGLVSLDPGGSGPGADLG